MVTGGEASEGAPATTDQNVVNVGAVVPSITSTISGLPISPVYSGVGFVPGLFKGSRHLHFTRGVAGARPHIPEVSYENNYIPQRRGNKAVVVKQKELIGDGEQHVDPLDNFKPQKFREGQTTVDDNPKQVEKEYRGAGKRAYKAENRGNREGAYHRQVRYSQA